MELLICLPRNKKYCKGPELNDYNLAIKLGNWMRNELIVMTIMIKYDASDYSNVFNSLSVNSWR
jgi:hypothetical protein